MMVRGLLKHESGCVRESSCVGMQEHTSMYIASVDGKCMTVPELAVEVN